MESLRWLALLLSIVLLLQCIGSCLPSPLHRLERFTGNDLRTHFDVLVCMPSASVNVALFAMFYEDRSGAIPWAALAECAGALAALLVTERSRLARSPDVQEMARRHQFLIERRFGTLSKSTWPPVPHDLAARVHSFQMQTRAHGSLASEAQGAVRSTAGPPTAPSNVTDIFPEELDFNALATDLDVEEVPSPCDEGCDASPETLEDQSSGAPSEASDLAERAMDRDAAQHAQQMALEQYLDRGDLSVLPQGVQRTVRQLRADVSRQLQNGVSGASTSL
ncbi:hypothetical protein AK812_SmicGene15731 [Symbiodinium microadriaticum]|uniref:Uncharacterized protein n=1 Tax=Symbiodinium microadriaticum TaxID=2951 RepID=A0A1Q9E285_SYMMI|nr:hypothetical protein AK812_SmicGene15731 [Symbiodinium microadriaticum]CAE7645064.1 unnamed protein product [Symbiodinium microadriaticum]CAE7942765.1 unnamed protein product [Symbiodinium sp. KB8]